MPSSTAQPSLLPSLAQLQQFWGMFPSPVPPQQPQLSQSRLLGLLRHVPMGSLVVLLFLWNSSSNWKPLPAPLQHSLLSQCGLR